MWRALPAAEEPTSGAANDESVADRGNALLRELQTAAGLSNSALARSVVAAGAAEGIPLGTTATSVRRMLDGARPHEPVPRLVASVLARRLGREISAEDCGFKPVAVSPAATDGLGCAGTLEGTVRTVLSLSGADMNRRSFLLGSAFVVGGFAQPAFLALTVPPVDSLEGRGQVPVDLADIEVLTCQLSHLRQLDHTYGASRVREQVVALVHRGGQLILNGRYSEKVGRGLVEAVAQATWLAGLMASDVGRAALAQRYYTQALNLAMSAGALPYAANVMSHMSRLTMHAGMGAADRDSLVLHARQSVALARGGLALGRGLLSPAQRALLHSMEARGLAVAGDGRAARNALDQAETRYAQVDVRTEPTWLAFYSPAEFQADTGRVLAALNDRRAAAQALSGALDGYEPWRARSRCFVLTDLAAVCVEADDHDGAARFGHEAVEAFTTFKSSRAVQRLQGLHVSVKADAHRSPALRSLSNQLARAIGPSTENGN